MDSKTAKCENTTQPKKQQKTDRRKVTKIKDLVSKWDGFFVAEMLPKSLKFTNSQKWTPGASRDPKGIQKGIKRHPKTPKKHPKGIQKASKSNPKDVKLVEINSHWNTNSEIPMQRTAKNHAL